MSPLVRVEVGGRVGAGFGAEAGAGVGAGVGVGVRGLGLGLGIGVGARARARVGARVGARARSRRGAAPVDDDGEGAVVEQAGPEVVRTRAEEDGDAARRHRPHKADAPPALG